MMVWRNGVVGERGLPGEGRKRRILSMQSAEVLDVMNLPVIRAGKRTMSILGHGCCVASGRMITKESYPMPPCC